MREEKVNRDPFQNPKTLETFGVEGDNLFQSADFGWRVIIYFSLLTLGGGE